MFKDDRMISILSGIVLMLAIGTLIQRQDVVSEYLGGDEEPEALALRPDAVEVAPDTLTRIDVLANDTGLPRNAAEQLEVVSQPGCGRVFVQGDALQFLAEIDCDATQSFDYKLAATETAPAAVTVTVRGATGIRNAPEPVQTRESVALAPQPAAPTAVAPALPRAATTGSQSAPALPRMVLPGSQAPEPSPADTGPSRVASAPRPGTPQPARPGAGRPGAPAPAAVLGGGAFGSNIGGADSESSGLSVASAPVAVAPSVPGGGAPAAPRALGGLTAPSAPSFGGGSGVTIAAAPSRPGAGVPRPPSVGTGAPSIGAPSAPSAPSGNTVAAAPSLPGGGGVGRPAAPGVPGVPGRVATAEPASPVLPGALASSLRPPSAGSGVSGATSSNSPAPAVPRAATPGAIAPRAATPTIALAQIDVPSQALAPTATSVEGLELDGPDVASPESANLGSAIESTGGEAVAFAEPSAGLGDIMAVRDMMASLPLLDTSGPEALSAPASIPEDEGVRVGALTPGTQTVVPDPSFGAAEQSLSQEAAEDTDSFEVVSLPSQDLACVVPPSITLDVRPAADTELGITSPCHADSIATVTYHDMTFGVPIDRSGRGSLMMHGFAANAETELEFADGEIVDFTVPFNGIERLERVALVWDQPISLNLHAFEFGAAEGEDGHVYREQRRDFRSVRRRGGGFMYVYRPVEGVGDSIQIYSHWVRRGGQAGVVKMYLDYESRDEDRLASTCGAGAFARPEFEVVRSSRGRMETSNVRRLAAVDCDDVGEGDKLIGAAVRDIIISQR
ncbi:MAG: hypothetical protein AAF577_11925 [Pseudomonadota bacterium]